MKNFIKILALSILAAALFACAKADSSKLKITSIDVAEINQHNDVKKHTEAGKYVNSSESYRMLKTDSNKTENTFVENLKSRFFEFTGKRPLDRVYLQFDKPFYYPGETIWFQAYARNGADMRPSEQSDFVHVEFINPKGNKEKELLLIAKNGTCGGDIQLDEDIAGGLYKVKAYTNWQKNETDALFFEKEILIQKVVLPGLKMKIDFLRESYGPGDEVAVRLDAQSLENQPAADKEFRYIVSLKGQSFIDKKGKTGKDGAARIIFSLPENLDTSDGLINVMIEHQGRIESISRSVPILLNNIKIGLFPEGGDLVQGINSRVAFRALNEFGKPADIKGIVVNQNDEKIAEFESFHQGMGSFRITPEKGSKYYVKITQPKGIDEKWYLPEPLDRGYTLETALTEKNFLKVIIRTTENEQLPLIAQIRGNIVYSQSIEAKQGENIIEIPLDNFPMGICQITLFDSRETERAERLVFVNRNRQLEIEVKTDKEKYLPREKVKMSVKITDERKMPVPGQVSLSVTDDKLLSFADDKSGHILSKLLLEPDLKEEVYEPNFYFDKKEEKSDQAMDFLMMTSGWRRFTWKEIMGNAPFSPVAAPEKAVVKGIVMTRYGNEPVKEAEVTGLSTGKTYVTNEKGEFQINDIELYQPIQLTAKKGNLKSYGYVLISDYNTPVTLYVLTETEYEEQSREERRREERDHQICFSPPEMSPEPQMEINPAVPGPRIEPEPAKEIPVVEVQDPRVKQDKSKIAKEAPGVVQNLQAPSSKYYRARVFPAPVYSEQAKVEVRTDFRSTIFWKGNIDIDRKGIAETEFYNSDEITSFRAVVEGIGADGLAGRKEHVYYTQLPFSMTVKVPVEVTMGDEVHIPLTLMNNTENEIIGKLNLFPPDAWRPVKPVDNELTVAKGKAMTIFIPYAVENISGKQKFSASFQTETDKDAFSQEVNVGAKGFPVSIAFSGQEIKKKFRLEINNQVQGTIRAGFTAYPTVLSDMLAGIESILQEPCGCFEQTSSSTYPNIMVLGYMKEFDYDSPQVMERAEQLIDKGYKRLISFETNEKGYEWFGSAPGHEALTAYGIMEFADMQKVYAGVQGDMMERTAKWLMDRKDKKGGFERNSKALDSFGRANQDITNAYIVYALSEAGFHHEILLELEQAYKQAVESDDPYQLALVANALFNLKDKRGEDIWKNLLKQQKTDGSWEGAVHSVTCSTGLGLKVETTALAVLAGIKSLKKDINAINKGVGFIVKSRSSYGGFGNTQSTVLALKALTAYAKFSRQTAEPGTVEIYIGDRKTAEKSYPAGEHEAVILDGLEKFFENGIYDITVKYAAVKNPLPYTFAVNYSTLLPPSSEHASVRLETILGTEQVKMGETARMNVKIKNVKDNGLPMTLAIVGIPGGLSPQPWQLKELQEKKIVDFYEVAGSSVIFYYREMKPGEIKEINLDLKADIPGRFEGAASSAYLYYTGEYKDWAAGQKIEILHGDD